MPDKNGNITRKDLVSLRRFMQPIPASSNKKEQVASFLNPKERASQTIAPRELTNKSLGYIVNNYVWPFIKGETKEGNVLTKESIPEHYGKGDVDPQIDMFRKYLGLDQHYDTMVESPHSEDSYTFSKPYKRKMIKDLMESYGGFEGVVDAHNLEEGEYKPVFDHKTRSYEEAKKSGKPFTGRASTLYPLGRYKEALKKDTTKDQNYISFEDKFDFSPQILENVGLGDALNTFNNPYKIKGRLYESSFSEDSLNKWKNQAGSDNPYIEPDSDSKRQGGFTDDKDLKNSYINSLNNSNNMPHGRPYIPYYMQKFHKKKALGGTIGSIAGGIAGIPLGNPMAGAAVGRAAGSGIEQLIQSGKEKEEPKEPINYASSSLGNYRGGGKMKGRKGYKEFSGPSHEQGGIQLSNGAEVEGGETMDRINLQGGKVMKDGEPYVFSKTLKVPGSNMSFAKYHKQLKERGAGEKAVRKLAMMQEKAAGRDNKQMPSGQGNKGESIARKGGKMKKYKGGGKVSMKQGAGAVPYGFKNAYQWYRGGGKMKKYQTGGIQDPDTELPSEIEDNKVNELNLLNKHMYAIQTKLQDSSLTEEQRRSLRNKLQSTNKRYQKLKKAKVQGVEAGSKLDTISSGLQEGNIERTRELMGRGNQYRGGGHMGKKKYQTGGVDPLDFYEQQTAINNVPAMTDVGAEEVSLDQDVETASVPEETEGMSPGEIATAPEGTFEGEGAGGGDFASTALQLAPDLINLATGVFGDNDTPEATQINMPDVPDYDTSYNINPLLRRNSAGYRAVLNNPNMNTNQKIAAYSQKLKSDSDAYARKENRENQMSAQKAQMQTDLEAQEAQQQAQFDAKARQERMMSDAQTGLTGNFARQSLSSISNKILQMKKEQNLSERDMQMINAMIEGYGGNETHKNYLRNLMIRGQ